MNMKNGLLAIYVLLLSSSYAQSEELAFSSYQIIGDSMLMAGTSQPITYVITHNPPMALMVLRRGAATTRQIHSGSLDGCTRLNRNTQNQFEQFAIKIHAPASETEMAIQLGAKISAERWEKHSSQVMFVDLHRKLTHV
jgi:hypothetical protein